MQEIFEAHGVSDRVVFHGYVSEHAMAKELPECDVFIQHSLTREGSPVAIVEAMASGLPVVSTAIGGIVDQVIDGETGYLMAQHDVTSMARAMTKLVDDDELRSRLGENARARAIELFDSSVLTEHLRGLVQDVARDFGS
jgi:glycosyltransferase involved in cell wall biosynthesis